jgi:hypothetical protein
VHILKWVRKSDKVVVAQAKVTESVEQAKLDILRVLTRRWDMYFEEEDK